MVHAALFLCRLLMTKMSEYGENVYGDSGNSFVKKWSSSMCLCSGLSHMPVNAFVRKQYPYSFPESHSMVDNVSSSEPEPSDYPTTLPACAFKSEEVMNLPRVSLQETDLMQ